MFYCNNCAEKNNWPLTFHSSHGMCECCEAEAICNELPSSKLPIPPQNHCCGEQCDCDEQCNCGEQCNCKK